MSVRTETMNISEVQSELDSLVDRIRQGEVRIVVENQGVPVAAFVPPQDLERLEQFEAEWEDDFAVFDEMSAAFAGVSPEEIERETAKVVAEVRAEMRAKRNVSVAR